MVDMSFIFSETFLKAMTIVLASMAIFGVLMTNMDMRLRIEENRWEGELIKLGETVAGTPCLSEVVNNNVRKGVFEKAKLDAAVADKSKCDIVYERRYFFVVEDSLNKWVFGDKSISTVELVKSGNMKCCKDMNTPPSLNIHYIAKECSPEDAEIKNPENIEKFCDKNFKKNLIVYPIAIKYSEEKIVPGQIKIYLERTV